MYKRQTSEIIRCLGGIAIGDLRNRALQLFRNEPLRSFLHHRLSRDPVLSREEWLQLLDMSHPLWHTIAVGDRHRIQDVFLQFEDMVSDKGFNFESASIGNILLKGLELRYGIQHALEVFLQLGDSPPNVTIMPCVCAQETEGLQLHLVNGDCITGQSEISHPSESTTQMYFQKNATHPRFAAAISELWYYTPRTGKRWRPVVNPRVIDAVRAADLIVYSIGSLVTSLMPSLIVPEIACAIGGNVNAKKVLLLNATYDRETDGLPLEDYVGLVDRTLIESARACACDGAGVGAGRPEYLTNVIKLQNGEIVGDETRIDVPINTVAGPAFYDVETLYEAISGLNARDVANV